MKIDFWTRLAGALPCIVLVSCVVPKVKILERPLPDSPAAELAKLKPASYRILERDKLRGLYRRDSVAALRMLHQRQQQEGDMERLVVLARLCGSLGAERADDDATFAAGCYLDAARLSFPAALQMAAAGPERDLRLIYNDSCAELACLLQREGHDWGRPARIDGPLTSHLLTPRAGGEGTVRPRSFDELFAANRIGLMHAEVERRRRDGIGGTLVGHRPPERIDGAEAQFVSSAGLVLPINASVEFAESGDRATVVLRDLTEIGRVTVAGRNVPLAAEWTAALAYLYQYAPTAKVGFEAMIRPDEFDPKTNLFELTPYRAGKIPLVFVHGLMSTPETWIKMIAALGSDPVVSENYQLLVFRYPTGYTISRNAAALRSKLAAYREMAEARGGGAKLRRMVLVGHSMGGILSNIQIRSSGDRVRALYLECPIEELDLPPEKRNKLRDLMIFEPVPSVERAVFIAAPHRGSELASNPIGKLGSRLIRLPIDLYNTGISLTQLERLPGLNQIARTGLASRPDSIKSLRPDSEFLATVVELPVAQRVSYHTIAGQAKRGDPVEDSTDRLVPYWSSHLDRAASEKIVDATHTTITKNAVAIEEVRRLLYLHLGLPAPAPLPAAEPAAERTASHRRLGRPNSR